MLALIKLRRRRQTSFHAIQNSVEISIATLQDQPLVLINIYSRSEARTKHTNEAIKLINTINESSNPSASTRLKIRSTSI